MQLIAQKNPVNLLSVNMFLQKLVVQRSACSDSVKRPAAASRLFVTRAKRGTLYQVADELRISAPSLDNRATSPSRRSFADAARSGLAFVIGHMRHVPVCMDIATESH